MTRLLAMLFVVGLVILTLGEFWQGVYKAPIIFVGAGLSTIPFVAIGIIVAGLMVRWVFDSE